MSILGLSSNSGDEPTGSLFVKFKPSANAWEEGKTEFDMTKVKIVFDMDSVKTGWMKWFGLKKQALNCQAQAKATN